jgi:hypothetical protein
MRAGAPMLFSVSPCIVAQRFESSCCRVSRCNRPQCLSLAVGDGSSSRSVWRAFSQANDMQEVRATNAGGGEHFAYRPQAGAGSVFVSGLRRRT